MRTARSPTHAPGFDGKRVINDKGEKGDANEAVIKALAEAGNIIARGRLKHQYPHSWRSKKPVIFRNTPQWFIAMDKDIDGLDDTLARHRALSAIKATRWVPAAGENRINGMIESRPDWVISRQRAWGVPIAVFVREKADGSVEILQDDARQRAHRRGLRAGRRRRLVRGRRARALPWHAAPTRTGRRSTTFSTSGSIPARRMPSCWKTRSISRSSPASSARRDGGDDTVMYLEGSDQHRGWFHSSLLESCGTRGRAPFDVVLTHGFVLDEQGRKMSKSLGNVVAPQDVIKKSGADILRMWVCASDYADDLRIGPEILKTTVETYRKLRNTIRWMLGIAGAFPRRRPRRAREDAGAGAADAAPARRTRRAGARRPTPTSTTSASSRRSAHFMTADLSAFYFDIRKDALYCDPISSLTRKAALTVIDQLFRCTVTWLAPMLCFTAEEAWLARYGRRRRRCICELFPEVPAAWRDDALAEKWRKVRTVRRVVTGALEIERAQQAHRLLARSRIRSCMCRTRSCSRRWSTSISPKSASPRPRRWSTAKGRPTRSGCRTCRASRSCRNRAEGTQVRALVEDLARGRRRSALSRRHAARRAGACANGKPLRKAAE